MAEPEVRSLERLVSESARPVFAVVSGSVRARCAGLLPFPIVSSFAEVPKEIGTLIVVGGGTLIDAAKIWRADCRPRARLAAIPSVWGSGAEATRIAVTNEGGLKKIRVDDALMPDVRAIVPEFAETLTPGMVKNGCGDAWAHAIEGFLSPLAGAEVRNDLAETMRRMLNAGIGNRPEWFELSARAAAGQAQSSVGLIHGLAHVIEGPMREAHPAQNFGHAGLCAVLAWPVLAFNTANSDKWGVLCAEYSLDRGAIEQTLRSLHDTEAFDLARPFIKSLWTSILRDPCTRTNSALVRPNHLAFFIEGRFQ